MVREDEELGLNGTKEAEEPSLPTPSTSRSASPDLDPTPGATTPPAVDPYERISSLASDLASFKVASTDVGADSDDDEPKTKRKGKKGKTAQASEPKSKSGAGLDEDDGLLDAVGMRKKGRRGKGQARTPSEFDGSLTPQTNLDDDESVAADADLDLPAPKKSRRAKGKGKSSGTATPSSEVVDPVEEKELSDGEEMSKKDRRRAKEASKKAQGAVPVNDELVQCFLPSAQVYY